MGRGHDERQWAWKFFLLDPKIPPSQPLVKVHKTCRKQEKKVPLFTVFVTSNIRILHRVKVRVLLSNCMGVFTDQGVSVETRPLSLFDQRFQGGLLFPRGSTSLIFTVVLTQVHKEPRNKACPACEDGRLVTGRVTEKPICNQQCCLCH